MLTNRFDTILGNIPPDWGTEMLQTILANHFPGDWGEERGENLVKVIRSTNLTNDGALNLSDVAVRALPCTKARLLEPRQHDILLEKSGGGPDQPIGRVGLIEKDMASYAFSNFLHLLRPNVKAFNPRFLAWMLFYVNRSGRTLRLEQQTTQMRNLHFRDYLTIRLPKPPDDEAKQIARILDAADTAIERTRTAIAKARRVKRGLVQDLFTNGIGHTKFVRSTVGRIPASWVVIQAGDALTEAQYGLSMPMGQRGKYPILRMAAIREGDVLLNDLKFVDLSPKVAAEYLISRGDILFNRTNSGELVGKVGIYRHNDPAVFASYLIRLKVNPAVADNHFLGQLLASHAVQCRIKCFATPGVQQVNINASNLQRVLIAVPQGQDGLEEQKAIAGLLERQDQTVRDLEKRVRLLSRLKRGLMQNLLTGRVRVGARRLG